MEVKAQEGGHWYSQDGSPAYTVLAKNGEPRPTTLRDARSKNLLPSVTTILNIIAKPGLEAWKLNQAIDAALTLPRLPDESLDDYKVRVIQDSKEQAKQAMQKGTDIHASLEQAYNKECFNPEHDVYVRAVMVAISEKFGPQNWISEKSFAHPIGYGGKIDLACIEEDTGIVIDFKTTEFDEEQAKKGKVGGYEEHLCQLAAYSQGLRIKFPRLANVYVSTSVPGLVHIVEYSKEDCDKGWNLFSTILHFWQISKGYKPCTTV